ncbi:hypothetical protein VULLAG_LOCUS9810 [Vulpes lagopus]
MECALRPRIRRWGRLSNYAAWLSPDSETPTSTGGNRVDVPLRTGPGPVCRSLHGSATAPLLSRTASLM